MWTRGQCVAGLHRIVNGKHKPETCVLRRLIGLVAEFVSPLIGWLVYIELVGKETLLSLIFAFSSELCLLLCGFNKEGYSNKRSCKI